MRHRNSDSKLLSEILSVAANPGPSFLSSAKTLKAQNSFHIGVPIWRAPYGFHNGSIIGTGQKTLWPGPVASAFGSRNLSGTFENDRVEFFE